MQPPPCGCVLKHLHRYVKNDVHLAAASVRLCVETKKDTKKGRLLPAAASVRLCVETSVK